MDGPPIVPEQAITVPHAVFLYTARAATVALCEGPLDQIAPGFEASFILLDRDPFDLDPDEIDQTNIAQTWITGEKVYTRD